MTIIFFALKLWFAVGIAVGYCWCNYAAPLVQGCCTFGAMVLALLVQLPETDSPAIGNCWSSYAVLLVQLSGTVGTRMLHSFGTFVKSS